MNRTSIRAMRLAALLIAVLGFSALHAPLALAQRPAPAATQLSVQPVAPVTAGANAVIVVHLTLVSGEPLPNQGVDLYVDDVRKQHVLSQADGSVTFNQKADFAPGTHRIKVFFNGTGEYAASNNAASLVVQAQGTPGLAITPGGPFVLGESIVIVARLRDSRGLPIAEQGVDMYVDDVRKQRVLSDANGGLTFNVRGDLAVGTHTVKLFFGGTSDLLATTSTAQFVVQAPGAAKLSIDGPDSIAAGDKATFVITLADPKGSAVVNQPIDLYLDGARTKRTYSDDSGSVSYKMPTDLQVGQHTFRADFGGTQGLGSTTASAPFTIKPPQLEVYTVPPLAGVKFTLGDKPFESGADGVARVDIEHTGTYTLTVVTSNFEKADIKAEFSRWNDEAFDPVRQIQVSAPISYQVGFNISYQVSQTFVDLDYQPVDPKRITSVTIKGSQGSTFTFPNGEPKWLPASRIVRRQSGLESSNLLYSTIEVLTDGSNVVSKEQQRFYVNPNDVWQIKLLLYTVQVTARDALFGFPMGNGLRLAYPNGRSVDFNLDPDGGITIRNLARGQYKFTITGAPGIAPTTPADVSRDQIVPLLVISYLDMALVLTVVTVVALGLILIGRPYLLHLRRTDEPRASAQSNLRASTGKPRNASATNTAPVSVPESALKQE